MSTLQEAVPAVERAVSLLGGQKTLKRKVLTVMDAHELLLAGIPSSALLHLVSGVSGLGIPDMVEKALGISVRTLQRRKKDKDQDTILTTDQGSRVWKLAEILGRAEATLGSREAAEEWMVKPAIGLDRRRPIDLMSTSAGVEMVETYLTQIEYGVYV